MKTYIQQHGNNFEFAFLEVPQRYHAALNSLYYTETETGFSKSFPADARFIDEAVQNFQMHGAAMVQQAAEEVPVPWQQAMDTFLAAIDGQTFDWWLCGSAALAVRGLAVEPHDIDLVVMGQDALRLAGFLRPYIIEPVAQSDGWVSDWFVRCFIHCRFEWIGTPNEPIDAAQPSDFGLYAASRLETVTWHGHAIRVPPLDLQLAVSQRRGLDERVKVIRAAMDT